jgi:putative PEP-CTERM system TPR-repeat lipoprotein
MTRVNPPPILIVLAACVVLAGCDLLTSPETRVERAEAMLDAGEYRKAVFELRKALEDAPDLARARLLLAEAEFGSGEVTAADADLDRALAAGIAPADAAVLKARIQLVLGREQVLLTQIDAGELVLPEPDRSLFRGRALLGMGRPAEAMTAFEEARGHAPGTTEVRIAIAEGKAAAGDIGGALADFAMLTKDEPTAAGAWLARGMLLLQQGRFTDGESALGEALQHARGRLTEPLQLQALAGQVEARFALNELDRAAEGLAELERRAANAPITRLLKARLAIARGDLGAAVTGLTALTNELPGFVPARLLLGTALLAQGNLYQAEKQLATVVQSQPGNLEARRRLAEIRLRMNRPQAAIDLLSSSLEGGFDDPRAVALLGAAQLSAGADPSAIARLEDVVARTPENRAARLDLAGLYITAGDPARAIALLRSVPAARDDARREYLLIRALATTQGAAEARREIEEMIREHPADVERLNMAAAFYLDFGDTGAAEAALEKAQAIQGGHVLTLVNLGRVKLARGDLDAADAAMRRALSHDAGNADARIGLAEIASRRGDANEARRWLEEIRIDDARAIASRLLLARLYLSAGEGAKASKVLAEVLASAPERTDLLVAAGELQQEFGLHEQALRYYRKAADLEPASADHWIHVARAQAALGYRPAARESIVRALTLAPASVDAVALAVMLDVMDGRPEAGLERVLALRRSLPQDAAAALLEGDLRSTLGQHAAAARAFAESARLRPSLPAVIRQAQASQKAGLPNARAPLQAWLQAHPDDLPARAMNAIFLDQEGRQDQAIAEYERVLAASQPDAVMSNNLAMLYFAKGDPRAETLARQAYRLAPTNGAIADTLGWILVKKGSRDEGLRVLREAATHAPQEPEIQLHLAEALTEAGQLAEAREVLERLLAGHAEFAGRRRAESLLQEAGR